MQLLDAIRLLSVSLVAFAIGYFLWCSFRLSRLAKRASRNIGNRRYDEAMKDYAALDRLATRLKLKMTSEFCMILASTMTQLGQLAESAESLERVARAFARKMDLTFFSRTDLLQAQTELSLAQGKIEQAERQSRMSLELLTPRVLPSSFELASAHRFLGVALSQKGSHDLAIEQFSISEQIRLKSMPQTHPRFIPLYDDWAEALNRMGRTDEAARRQSQADGVRELCKAYS